MHLCTFNFTHLSFGFTFVACGRSGNSAWDQGDNVCYGSTQVPLFPYARQLTRFWFAWLGFLVKLVQCLIPQFDMNARIYILKFIRLMEYHHVNYFRLQGVIVLEGSKISSCLSYFPSTIHFSCTEYCWNFAKIYNFLTYLLTHPGYFLITE